MKTKFKKHRRNSKHAIELRNNDDIRHGKHCVYNIHVHLVFVTKYRKGCFNSTHLTEMKTVFEDVLKSFDAELKE